MGNNEQNQLRAMLTLKRYRKTYRSPSEIEKKILMAKGVLREVEELKEPSPLPKQAIGKFSKSVEVIKFYSTINGILKSYFDDGCPLPSVEDLIVISQPITIISKNGIWIQTDLWMLQGES